MEWNDDIEIMVTALSERGIASLGGFRASGGDEDHRGEGASSLATRVTF